jgi:hypothetical protein
MVSCMRDAGKEQKVTTATAATTTRARPHSAVCKPVRRGGIIISGDKKE